MKKIILFYILIIYTSFNIFAQHNNVNQIKCGADRIDVYLPLIENKKVGIVAHKASFIYKNALNYKIQKKYNIKNDIHLVDFLATKNIDIQCVFAPEHGFRGNADAGEKINSGIDEETGIMVCSLYDGDTGKPNKKIMSNLDVVIFDIQDVGLRFYTYLTSLVKVMESCVENNVKLIILDRPNPNGHYVDGPILDMKYKSAVGYIPITIVHGMTLGEIANMVNGEGWLPNSGVCDVTVIKCENYSHKIMYELPVPPSPNLPNMRSVYLYPSMCYFEATPVSLGRGTDFPFQCYGHPNMLGYEFVFTPESRLGAKNPPQMGLKCYGNDLTVNPPINEIFKNGVDLTYLIDAYNNLHIGDHFFRPFFEKLIGVDWVRKMIKEGKTADEIKDNWATDIDKFQKIRRKYLIYKE